MANHASAKKAAKQIVKRSLINKSRLSKVKTFIKKYVTLLSSDSGENIENEFSKVQSEIARAVTKGVINKNKASRMISSLHNKLKAQASK